jgi:hypothetical protein
VEQTFFSTFLYLFAILFLKVYSMLSEVFWVAFFGTATGFLIKLASMAYKSKCKEFSCCCMKIVRDVETEEKETEFLAIHRPIPENNSSSNI